MHEKQLEVGTGDGVMETFLAAPSADATAPVVVIYMDAPGIREELRGFARRIAGEGYCALLPDLYYRRGRVRFSGAMSGGQMQEMFAHMNSLTNAMVVADTRSLLAALEAEPTAAPGPKGCIGYCMSGQFVTSVAGRLPDHFRATVSCYGVRIVTDEPDSPHRLLKEMRGEVFYAFAEKDRYVPNEAILTLIEDLDEAEVESAVEIYPGTDHGFCFPEREGAYVKDAAEDVWRRSFALFARQLRP